MGFRLLREFFTALLITGLASTLANAQGSFFTSLSGTVVDGSGAVIPGADVKVKNTGTGAASCRAVTEASRSTASRAAPIR